MGYFVRSSFVSTLCPAAIGPYLCTSEERLTQELKKLHEKAVSEQEDQLKKQSSAIEEPRSRNRSQSAGRRGVASV